MTPYKKSGKRISPTGDRRRMDEHRWLMELKVGRRLKRFELVHHINGDKRDNRIDNLMIVTPAEHAREHGQWKHSPTKKCLFCGSEFTPHPTKRARAKTCSKSCRYALTAQTQSDPEGPRSKYRPDAYPSEVASRRLSQNSSKPIWRWHNEG